MTGDLSPQAADQVAERHSTTYHQPQYQPMEPGVRGMPVSPRGTRGYLRADNMLDLGALATASGMTQTQIQKFLDQAQEAALKAVLESAPHLLRHNRMIAQARINEVAVRISKLRRISMVYQQQGLLNRLTGLTNQQQMQDAPVYVSLAEVENILNEALAALSIKEY